MVTRASTAEKLEDGDIFFFYRPRVDHTEVHGRGDVQRFYMVLAGKHPHRSYRLLVIGRKKLPTLTPGQHPERRNWALVVKASPKPDDIRRELAAYQYETQTRGTRFVAAATPVGEGRYMLLRHRSHTELAYALELPKHPGPAQHELEIPDEASYIVAVKNPEISAPGAPAASRPPAYPPRLRDKFGAHRWIDAEPALLDYENTQLLLLAAHAEQDVETELGVHIPTEDEKLATAEVCRELRVRCEREAVVPLLDGTFPGEAKAPPTDANARYVCAYDGETFDQRSRYERHMASAHPPHAVTAADLEHAIAGIDLPKSRNELVAYATSRVPPASEVLRVLHRLPARTYRTAADVAKAFGQLKARRRHA